VKRFLDRNPDYKRRIGGSAATAPEVGVTAAPGREDVISADTRKERSARG